MDEIAALWERYGTLDISDLPPRVTVASAQCILDWLGVALAGSREPLAQILRDVVEAERGPCTLFGSSVRVSPRNAALVNGSAGHALDFDDTNLVGGLHATSAVLPAALAFAESTGRSGSELLVAYVVGVEICARLRAAVGEEHYEQGWHVTSTLGIFGAVAAASWLLQLDVDHFQSAVGIAASEVSGVHANFGTMTKPFHAGHAAADGLLAAELAVRGFTSSAHAFESVMTQTAGTFSTEVLAALDGIWAVEDTLIKRFACGAGTEAAVVATLGLMADGLHAADLLSAEIHVPPDVPSSAYGVRRPASGLEIKFSLPGTMALALLGHDLSDPEVFSDENVETSAFAHLIDRIALVGDPDVKAPGFITVKTSSGAVSIEMPFTRDAGSVESRDSLIRSKFRTLGAREIGGDNARLVEHLVLDEVLGTTDVVGLLGLLSAGGSRAVNGGPPFRR